MTKNYYIPGEHNLICDVCSKKIKAHDAKLRWDGFMVCKDDWEPRQPQDFVRAKIDKIVVPVIRPIPNEPFALRQGIFDVSTLTENVSISSQYYRSFIDNNNLIENFFLNFERPLTDNIQITDTVSLAVSKIFNDVNTYTDSVINTTDFNRTLSDTTTYLETLDISKYTGLTDINTLSDTGVINLPVYAIDYFAEDYTETTRTF